MPVHNKQCSALATRTWSFAFVVVSCIAVMADAAPPSESKVRSWIEAQLQKPPASMRLRDVKIEYTQTRHAKYTPAELIAIEAEVRKDATHPAAEELQSEQRLRDRGPTPIQFAVWWKETGAWRFNVTYSPLGEFPYLDVVVTPKTKWQLTSEQLAITDPGRPSPAQISPEAYESQIQTDLTVGVDAWLNSSLAGPSTVSAVSVNGSAWRATVSSDRVSQDLVGRWDEPFDRGFVSRSVFTRTPSPDGPGLSIEYENWTQFGDAGEWIAGKVTTRYPNGRANRVYEFSSPHVLDHAEFAAVTATPKPLGSDSIRGKLTVNRVYDFTKGEAAKVDQGSQDVRTVGVLPRGPDTESRWTLFGWISLTAIIGTLVFLRFRSKPTSGA